MPFVKLDTGIPDSSLWSEPATTCKCWITLLAMMDSTGLVRSTAPGISQRSQITVKQAVKALETFEAPDPHSRSLNDEGRRIKRVEGGYQVINSEKYRKFDYTAAERMKRHRERVTRNGSNETVTLRKQKQSTEADTDKKKEEGANGSRPTFDLDKWIDSLSTDPTYHGLNPRVEWGKMLNWCKVHGKQPTQRRFINWLNRADKPLPVTNGSTPKMSAFEITKRLEAIEERLGQTVFDKEKHKDEREKLQQRRRELKAQLRT